MRDGIEPTPQSALTVQGAGLPREGKKGRLKRVLGVLGLAQHTLTDAQDHRPVPPNERCKGLLVAHAAELLQEFSVRQFPGRSLSDVAEKLPQGSAERSTGHELDSLEVPPHE
jgi:hypothetical protein